VLQEEEVKDNDWMESSEEERDGASDLSDEVITKSRM